MDRREAPPDPSVSGLQPEEQTPNDPAAERIVAASFVLTMVAGVAVLGVYLAGGQTQIEGALLFLALGGLGVGITVWAHRLLPNREHIELRHRLADPRAERELAATLKAEEGIGRRTMLLRLLAGAIGGLAAALAIPVLSLGPGPGRDLFVTRWRKGLRAVDMTGAPVHAADLEIGGVLTVFPEGSPGSANSQTLLIRVEPGLLRLPPDRAAWAPNGYVAYSKVCTHAGGPVGLYRAAQHRLICPCHQSTFDVLDGAQPTFGPAARPLPQLPIALQPDGTFVALGDFPEPVGPSFWNRTQHE